MNTYGVQSTEEAEESLTCSQLKEVCWYMWKLQALAIIAIIVAILFCENKSPPPTTPFISLSPRLTALKSKPPHLEGNDCLVEARQTLDDPRLERKNNRRTTTIASTVRRTYDALVFIIYLPSKAFRTRLPWDVHPCQCDAKTDASSGYIYGSPR